MNCPKCGTPLQNGVTKCHVCGTAAQHQTIVNAPTKTKSKMLAAILMLFSLGDLYLGYYKRFWIKIFVVALTFGFGVIWPIVDTVKVINGSINCDANGTPLV